MNAAVIGLHALVIVLAYSSPLWLGWRLLLVGVLLYYLQLLIFGWCILSLRQFHGQKRTFHEWYLSKLGFTVNTQKLRFVLNYVIPPLLVLAAMALQLVLNLSPIVDLYI